MTYVQNYVVARSCNHCCYEKATVCSLFIFGADVVTKNMKVFRIAMKMQQWNPFSILTSYKIFRTAVNKKSGYVLYITGVCLYPCLSYLTCTSHIFSPYCIVICGLSGTTTFCSYCHLWPVWHYHSLFILSSVTCLALPHFVHIVICGLSGTTTFCSYCHLWPVWHYHILFILSSVACLALPHFVHIVICDLSGTTTFCSYCHLW
jgi:hypothetical protein